MFGEMSGNVGADTRRAYIDRDELAPCDIDFGDHGGRGERDVEDALLPDLQADALEFRRRHARRARGERIERGLQLQDQVNAMFVSCQLAFLPGLLVFHQDGGGRNHGA